MTLGNTGSSTSQAIDDLKKTKESVDDEEISPEAGKEVEDVIIDTEHARVERIKAETKRKPVKNNDLEIFVTFRNQYGRILRDFDLEEFRAEFIFEGVGGPETGDLFSSGSRYGDVIKNFELSTGTVQILLYDSGGIAFSGQGNFTLSRKAMGLVIDASMAKKTIEVTFNESESITESLTNKISGELGVKMSVSAKATFIKMIEAVISNEVSAKLASERTSSEESSSTTEISVKHSVHIPTGDLDLKITEV